MSRTVSILMPHVFLRLKMIFMLWQAKILRYDGWGTESIPACFQATWKFVSWPTDTLRDFLRWSWMQRDLGEAPALHNKPGA